MFVSCKRQGIVLPGTLLGLFPGVVCDPHIPLADTPKRSVKPFFRRADGYWLDYQKELPYPMPPAGANFSDFFDNLCYQSDVIISMNIEYL